MREGETTARDLEVAWADAPGGEPSGLGPPRYRWEDAAHGLRVRGFGAAAEQSAASAAELLRPLAAGPALPEGPGPWFVSIAFEPGAPLAGDWRGFGAARATLPRLLWWSDERGAHLAAFGPDARRGLDEALKLVAPRREPSAPPAARRVADPGARARWDETVGAALAAIAAHQLEKVVLARALEVSDAPDPDAVFARLAARYPACRAYLVREGDATFLGATPETFLRLRGRTLFTEALAGSAPLARAHALLDSGKELREHRWVVDHLRAALTPLCERLSIPATPRLERLPNVAHLQTPVTGELRAGLGAADVAAALHPTPAVGGAPRAAALAFLRAHEGLDRGLYAGLVGLAGPGQADLAVALRCALLRDGRARLFVGAGIVAGSDAAAEWQETELKAQPLLEALGALA